MRSCGVPAVTGGTGFPTHRRQRREWPENGILMQHRSCSRRPSHTCAGCRALCVAAAGLSPHMSTACPFCIRLDGGRLASRIVASQLLGYSTADCASCCPRQCARAVNPTEPIGAVEHDVSAEAVVGPRHSRGMRGRGSAHQAPPSRQGVPGRASHLTDRAPGPWAEDNASAPYQQPELSPLSGKNSGRSVVPRHETSTARDINGDGGRHDR